MKIRQFLLSHRKIWITLAVLVVFISTSVYQSIYANDDGIPTTTVYWLQENPLLLDRDATWILPQDGGYLSVTNDGTLAVHINAGMSLSFVHTADDAQKKFHACFAEDEVYRILCTEQTEDAPAYSLRTVSSDGDILSETVLPEATSAYVDCRMNGDILALVTESQFLVFSVSDTPQLLYTQDYTGTSPQVCITEDTVFFSISAKQESLLYEYNTQTNSQNTASLSYAPLFALAAAPEGTDSKYLIGCGVDLLGMDAQFSVIERFLDLRESWERSTVDSTVIQTLTQDSITAIHTDGTALYITDTRGQIFKFDVFWGEAMQTSLS